VAGFWERRREQLKAWWRKPLKWWEHTIVCVATIIYFGIIGTIVGLLWGGVPIYPLHDLLLGLAKWGVPAAAVGGLLAYFFPKVMLCIIYPFSLIGVGSVEVT
jgi:hypothetical protein